MNSIKLTQTEVLSLTPNQRIKLLEYYQDKACNTDYIKNPIESDVVQYNINFLESKILYNEY